MATYEFQECQLVLVVVHHQLHHIPGWVQEVIIPPQHETETGPYILSLKSSVSLQTIATRLLAA